MLAGTDSYAAFSVAYHAAAARQRTPANVTIEISHRCPLNCQHCYNNLPVGDEAARRAELSTEEQIRILDEMADAGSLWLLFTGGEIFARRDFLDVYTHAKRRGFIITLFTNGTLVSPRIADHLVSYRPFSIEITLYGRTKETYEALTRVPGSYEACLRGIRLLKERNLPLTVKTVAVTVNRHEIWEMRRYVEEELGLPFRFDAMMSPRIDCSQSPLATRLSPEEIVELDLRDPRRVDDWQTRSSVLVAPPRGGTADEVYHCGGGVHSFSVDPTGQMAICGFSRRDEYSLRNGTVAEGWGTFLKGVRQRKATRVTKCTACHLRSACGMCPANGELENGDPEEPVDFLCHVAHLRAETLGWKVPAHGDCEYCPGGERRALLEEETAALRRRLEDSPVPAFEPPPQLLPALPLLAARCGAVDGGAVAEHGVLPLPSLPAPRPVRFEAPGTVGN
ncbi:MAG: radical SAM protein, partial [Acidobacteria bacterium ACB2]|nr:radical SAM protein [Acidobacteria bacterium ACB2]